MFNVLFKKNSRPKVLGGSPTGLLNQKGFTLPEIVASIAIVATTVYVSTQYMTQQKGITDRVAESNSCSAYISHMQQKISSMGMRLSVNRPSPLAHVLDLPSASAQSPMTGDSITGDGIPDSQRWPTTLPYNLMEYSGAYGSQIFLRSSHLYSGALTALLAIYNSSGGYCSAPQAYSGTFFADGDQFGLANLQAQIQIQPYELDNNPGTIISPCPTNLIIKPKGHPGSATQRVASLSPNIRMLDGAQNVRDDVGLLVTIVAAYDDERGGQSTCTGQMKFKYPADIIPPQPIDAPSGSYTSVNEVGTPVIQATATVPAPAVQGAPLTQDGNAVNVDTGGGCVGGNPIDNQGNVDFTITYDSNLIEAGSVLVCRDQSRMLNASDEIQCRNSSGVTISQKPAPRTSESRQDFSDWATPPEFGTHPSTVFGSRSNGSQKIMDDMQYLSTARSTPFVSSSNWVPCSQVQVCQRNPTTASWSTAGSVVTLNLDYDNIVEGCNAKLEYAWVDPAGNISQVRAVNHIIQVAECGALCHAPSYSYYYYQCGGCP